MDADELQVQLSFHHPALSLPNMLVINSVIGPKKAANYVLLVVTVATLSGWLYGMYFKLIKGEYNMKIQILGTGCAKCNKLADATRQAADALGLDYEMEKVTDMLRFADFGVMITPAMAVDGEVKVSGRVPDEEALKSLLSN